MRSYSNTSIGLPQPPGALLKNVIELHTKENKKKQEEEKKTCGNWSRVRPPQQSRPLNIIVKPALFSFDIWTILIGVYF